MYHYKTNLETKEHDDFVKNSPQVNLLQSSNWAKVKDNWGNLRVGFYQSDKLVGVASILIRPLPLGLTMFYIPRGPVMDYHNNDLVTYVFQSLKTIAKKHKAVFITFDPNLILKQYQLGQESDDSTDTLQQLTIIQGAGAIWAGRTQDMSDNIQPRFQANIHKDNFDLSLLTKKNRQEIRTAQNKGLTVETGGVELLPDFANLMAKTAKRKQINLRGEDYYRTLLTHYKDHAHIVLTSLDLEEQEASLNQKQEALQKTIQSFTDKTKPGKKEETLNSLARLEKELAFIRQEKAKGLTRIPLAATLTIDFGQTSDNLYAGMDEDYRHYQPAVLTWYHTALKAFERGVTWHNMGGIENQLDGGLIQFKAKFNPTIQEYIGEFELPVRPILYKLAKWAYKQRQNLRRKH